MNAPIQPRSRPTERCEAAEAELQRFSYIVSHDLAAVFRHVAEFSRLMLNEAAGELNDRGQAHAERVRSAVAECQAMLDALLAFSRVQQKPLELACRDVTSIVRLCLMQLSSEIGAAQAQVTLEPVGEAMVDSDLLATALRHLLDNALKFARPDAPPTIVIGPAHTRGLWRLRIADNGVGVPAPYREKAFDMFQKLSAGRARPGVGAGLAIARRIARRHGGDLVFLNCDQGASLELSLPRGRTALSNEGGQA